MADPFGAIHNQNIGDIGVFVGNGSWAASGQMPADIAAKIHGPRSVIQINEPEGRRLSIVDGSSANPVTTDSASLMVSRYEVLSSPTAHNSAITGIDIGDGSAQPNGIIGIAWQLSNNGDACGVSGSGVNLGNAHAAFGGFFVSSASVSGGGSISVETAMGNTTGDDPAYSATIGTNRFIGIDVATDAGQVGVQVRGNGSGGNPRVGYSVLSDGAREASFRTDDSATAVLVANGTHTYVVDVSGGTITTGWHGKFTIDNEVQITRATGSAYFERFVGTGTGAKTWGVTVLTNSRWALDEVGVQQVFQIAPGTPGANLTSLYILEGATPTLRQITTFDPGAAGVNFTAGQLVAVLV